ncbi:MAG: hypothetical protein R3F39_16975 [Myxococcota bacterium]
MRALGLAMVVLGALALVGCDDSTSTTITVDEAVKAGCAHFLAGPQTLLTATATDEATTPLVTEHHHRYVATLVKETVDTYAGYMKYAPTEAGRFLLMFTSDTPLTVTKADGTVATPTRVERALPECAEARVIYEFDLHKVEYTLYIGPVMAAGLTMVVHLPPVAGGGSGADAHGGH